MKLSEKPERHLWEEGSTHRAVAGKEYDEVWDYVEALEEELAKHGPFCFEPDTTPESWKQLQDDLAQSRADNARLREALEFYRGYAWGECGRPSAELLLDMGAKAGAALEAKDDAH